LPTNQAATDLGAIDPTAAGLQTEAEPIQPEASAGTAKTWLLGGGAGLALGVVALGLWFGVNKRRKKDLVFAAETKATEVTALQEESVISDTVLPKQTVPITEAIADVAVSAANAPVVPKVQEPSFQDPVEPQQTLEELVVESAHKLTDQSRLAQDNQKKSTPEPAVEELAEIEAEAINTETFEANANNVSAQDAIPDLQEEADYASMQQDSLASDVDLNFPEDTIETPGANAERSILDDLGDLERSAAAAQAELDALRKAAMPVGTTAAQPAKDVPEILQALTDDSSEESSDDAFEKAMADLNLDIPAEPLDEASWQEVATKLDLAGAYVEIGDSDGARELLDEIVRKGDSDQVREAKALLGALA
jgi:FimV-like protein